MRHECLSRLFLSILLLAPATAATTQLAPPFPPLASGEPVARSIAAGETHTYALQVDGVSFLRLTVEGMGTLIRVRVEDDRGTVLATRERRGGSRDPIVWRQVVTEPARYVVRVTSLETEGVARQYTLTLRELRQANQEDAGRVGADRAIESAQQLELAGDRAGALASFERGAGAGD